jgi:hypothetical protein
MGKCRLSSVPKKGELRQKEAAALGGSNEREPHSSSGSGAGKVIWRSIVFEDPKI